VFTTCGEQLEHSVFLAQVTALLVDDATMVTFQSGPLSINTS
jgi:hypothetical protein